MHRRAFLSGLAVGAGGLSGCIGSPNSTATDAPTESRSTSSASAAGPAIELSAEPLRAATADRPGRVRVTLVNRGDPTTLSVDGRLPLPPRPGERLDSAEDLDGPIPVLLPTESDHERRNAGRCWASTVDSPDIADDAPWDWGHGTERTVRFASGDRYTGTYDIVASWTTYCYPAGRYRFERHLERDGELLKRGIELTLPLESDG